MEFKELIELFKVNPENTVFWTRVFSGILLGYNGFRYISPNITEKLSAMKQHHEHDAEVKAAELILQKRYKNYYGKDDIIIPRKEKR